MTGLQKLCALVTNRSGKSRRRKQSNNRFVVYYRVSTKQQGESGLGLDAQKAAAEAYIKQHGGEIIAEYEEIESGKDCKRPKIMKPSCMQPILGHAWSSPRLDRLARNVLASSSTLMECNGIDFVACDNPTASRLTIHILAAVAEEEAGLISERTKAALQAYKARGGVLGRRVFRIGDAWQPKQEQSRKLATLRNAEIAAAAYEEVRPIILSLRSQGRSFQAIADELNRLGPSDANRENVEQVASEAGYR